ncbi:EthD domain-containing protein [Sphingobium sp.]|uniref:EthD domain-containing protein n=1 Tax=Sphingobium sp. TaxID=1912891 RepID=UPI0028BE420A|nr:EthD domain-containing protein [Sphingobium sp.]
MICVLGFYKRKPGLTHEEFCSHWKNVHAKLAMETPEIAKYIRKYVQHRLHPTDVFPGVESAGYDGMSEVWVDTIDDFRAMAMEPKFQELMAPDEEKFIDLAAKRIMMVDDPQIIR